ncbi:hypothetical protein BGZ60DRAFT_558689 [Tricladium varicosporioides]|nr:hypothetical protein BGZ60DRAFT_558689 [Hymenoscyphus varicosporioides]
MQLNLHLLIASLAASTIAIPLALPITKVAKKSLLDIDPSVDIDLLDNLCVGIAVCNPVTVTDNGKKV